MKVMVSSVIVSVIVSVLSAIISVLLFFDLQPPLLDSRHSSYTYSRWLKMLTTQQQQKSSCASPHSFVHHDNHRAKHPQCSIEQRKRRMKCIDIFQNRSSSVRVMKNYLSYFLCVALLLHPFSIGIRPAHATLFVNNNTYATLPALFGRYMVDGKTYEARLQYFHDNPYLCEMDEKTLSKFVPPTGGVQINHFGGSNLTIYEESVALLVVRGNCPFQKKASVAELIDDSVKVLLIANFNLDNVPEEDETLVPMYSQYGDTRLVLLSISHATGQALKKYLSEIPDDITKLGGPIIEFDSIPPYGLLTEGDLESMMFSALGVFFMLISFTGCLVILTGTYHQLLMNQNGGGGNPITAATQRRLLTEEEVQQFTTSRNEHNANATNHHENDEARPSLSTSSVPTLSSPNSGMNGLIENEEILDNVEADQCAVCLGEFDIDEDETIAILPCQHKFHTTCITPWLTERQSKCPLCKFDVLQHIREAAAESTQDSSTNDDATPDINAPDTAFAAAPTVSFWDQLRRYRWTSISTTNSHDERHDPSQLHLDGVMRMVEVLSANDLIIDYNDDSNHHHRRQNSGTFEMTTSRIS